MAERKHSTPWKDRPAAEKITLIIGWCVIASLMAYAFLPNKPEPSAPLQSVASEAQPSTARYNGPSAQALSSATQHLLQLDSAMAEGIQILKAGQLRELNAHSQRFKSLLEGGYAQFGRSVFQPLGKCTSAAIFANSWWQAHVTAVRQGGTEPIPGAIQSHLDEYTLSRADCLQSANPSVETATPTTNTSDRPAATQGIHIGMKGYSNCRTRCSFAVGAAMCNDDVTLIVYTKRGYFFSVEKGKVGLVSYSLACMDIAHLNLKMWR